jgi:hypothetical protein
MLSDIILIGNNKNGSFALADTKQSMLAAALQSQLLNIADVFNSKAVPDLFSYNNFEGLTGLPKIVPGQIQTPSLKELALVIKAMGLNIAGDMKLQNYLRHILNIPALEQDVFEEVYKPQMTKESTDNTDNANQDFVEDDTVDNVFEQDDMY